LQESTEDTVTKEPNSTNIIVDIPKESKKTKKEKKEKKEKKDTKSTQEKKEEEIKSKEPQEEKQVEGEPVKKTKKSKSKTTDDTTEVKELITQPKEDKPMEKIEESKGKETTNGEQQHKPLMETISFEVESSLRFSFQQVLYEKGDNLQEQFVKFMKEYITSK